MYEVKPQTCSPLNMRDKKSMLHTSSGTAPKHNWAKAKNGLLSSNAKPRMMNVWLLNHAAKCRRSNTMNVRIGVRPIIRKIQPNNTLFCIIQEWNNSFKYLRISFLKNRLTFLHDLFYCSITIIEYVLCSGVFSPSSF